MSASRVLLALTALALSVGIVAVTPPAGSAAVRPPALNGVQESGLRELDALERSASGGAFANPRVSGPCPCYFYNAMAQPATATGISAKFSQPMLKVGAGDSHSLMELVAQSLNGHDAIEFGWEVYRGSPGRHLFVSYTSANIAHCPNVCGFVSTSNPGAPRAGDLIQGAVATYSIRYMANADRWNLTYNGKPLGYFPESRWLGRFTKMHKAQASGEVASGSTTKPRTQMGNGKLGTAAASATVTNFSFIGGSNFKPIDYYDADKPAGLYVIGKRSPNSCMTNCFMHYGGPGYTGP